MKARYLPLTPREIEAGRHMIIFRIHGPGRFLRGKWRGEAMLHLAMARRLLRDAGRQAAPEPTNGGEAGCS